jgi:hypothetical protein
MGATGPAEFGAGNKSGFCGKACTPPSGVEAGDDAGAGVGVGNESRSGGKAGDAGPGLEIGDAAGAAVETGEERGICASSCHPAITAAHPTAMNKCFLTGMYFLMGMLVQKIVEMGGPVAGATWTGEAVAE